MPLSFGVAFYAAICKTNPGSSLSAAGSCCPATARGGGGWGRGGDLWLPLAAFAATAWLLASCFELLFHFLSQENCLLNILLICYLSLLYARSGGGRLQTRLTVLPCLVYLLSKISHQACSQFSLLDHIHTQLIHLFKMLAPTVCKHSSRHTGGY